jgi:exodeoxyribonuclease V alpha subunit
VHPKHGKQLVVKAFAAKLPSSVHGIKKYLASGLIKGIGKRYACKIVDHFGVDTFRVISEQSALLQNVPGIGSGRAHAIKKAWDSQMAVRDIMLFLKTYGVSSSLCLKLVKEYGHQAKAVLLQDPYQVAKHIRGIGFKTADKIALNLGFASDSTQRIDAGLAHVLENFEDEGHTCARHELLLERAVQILQAPCEKIEERLKVLIQLQAIVRL